MDRTTRYERGLVVEPRALHDMARTLRGCATSLRVVERAAAGTCSCVDDVAPPARGAAQDFVGAVRRALETESDALDVLARSLDAAARDYVAQERRVATALGG